MTVCRVEKKILERVLHVIRTWQLEYIKLRTPVFTGAVAMKHLRSLQRVALDLHAGNVPFHPQLNIWRVC